MKNVFTTNNKGITGNLLLMLAMVLVLCSAQIATQAQCNPASGFTKITNTSGTVTYPGTNGSPAVAVTTTATGDISTISFCGITNGYRAGQQDHSGSWRFAFSPAVNGIAINLNALSNTPDDREVVRIRINDVLYTVTPANIVCTANCFGCSGVGITATGGAIASAVNATGNGTGQLIIQGAGLINSIEYVNEVQSDEPEGSVFEIFFNNSTCILPIALYSFTATTSLTGTQLSWVASAEINGSHYQVERSTDGTHFKTIAQVPVTNSGSYQYTDALAAGTNYYRLKIVEKDGSYTYSKIVIAILPRTGNKIILSNPIANVLSIVGLQGSSTIAVYTVTGKQLIKLITGNSTETVNTANWPAGVYIVSVISNGKMITTEKVIRQ